MNLKAAVRRNRGRRAAPGFLAKVSTALGEVVEQDSLCSLAETDEITLAIRADYQAAAAGPGGFRKLFRSSQRGSVFQLADRLAGLLGHEPCLFVPKLSEDCGAVRSDLATLLSHTASLLRFDGDSLTILSEDRNEGILIDQNVDDLEQAYEVAIWVLVGRKLHSAATWIAALIELRYVLSTDVDRM